MIRTPVGRNVVLGIAIALVLVTFAIDPQIAGVSAWKWVLGVLGVVLFVLAGRKRDR